MPTYKHGNYWALTPLYALVRYHPSGQANRRFADSPGQTTVTADELTAAPGQTRVQCNTTTVAFVSLKQDESIKYFRKADSEGVASMGPELLGATRFLCGCRLIWGEFRRCTLNSDAVPLVLCCALPG